MVDIEDERKVDVLRETVRILVSDVTLLKENTFAMKTDLALTRQAQDQFRSDVKEYMLRSDTGRAKQEANMELLLRNKIESDFTKRLVTVCRATAIGLATIWAAYSTGVSASAHSH